METEKKGRRTFLCDVGKKERIYKVMVKFSQIWFKKICVQKYGSDMVQK